MSSYSYRLATTEYRIKKKKRIEFKNHKRNYFPYFVFSLILSSTTTANVHYSLNNILDYQRVTNTTDNTSLILYIRQTYRTYFYTNTHTPHTYTEQKVSEQRRKIHIFKTNHKRKYLFILSLLRSFRTKRIIHA